MQFPSRSLRTQFAVLIGDECRRRPIAWGSEKQWSEIINAWLEVGCKRVESDSSTRRDIGDTQCVFASRLRGDGRNQGLEKMHGIGSNEAYRDALWRAVTVESFFLAAASGLSSRKVPSVTILLTACHNVRFFARCECVTFSSRFAAGRARQ
jgi:hypothetical protein